MANTEVDPLARYAPIPKVVRAKLNNDFKLRTASIVDAFSSGDIVGNGGGIIEQNFQFAFNSVLPAIDHCLIKLNCNLSNKDKIVLMAIKSTYFMKLHENHNFIFLREKDANGLFNEVTDPAQRIAKTGFSYDFPIFINLDAIEGNSDLTHNLGTHLAIVIHELGHQAGYASHSLLDNIAGKLRLAFSYQMDSTSLNISGDDLIVNIYNNPENLKTQVSYYFNHQLRFLSFPIEESLQCDNERSPVGYSLTNEHWQRLKKNKFSYLPKLNMWIDIFCEDETGTIYTDEKDIEINFEIDIRTKKLKEHKIQIK